MFRCDCYAVIPPNRLCFSVPTPLRRGGQWGNIILLSYPFESTIDRFLLRVADSLFLSLG